MAKVALINHLFHPFLLDVFLLLAIRQLKAISHKIVATRKPMAQL